jgi:hypothetical protein
VLAFFLLAGEPAEAACSSPTGVEGTQIYNTDYHTMEFCNGTNWIAAGANSALSVLTAAISTNTIDNTLYTQTWNWSTLATGTSGLSLNATNASGGANSTLTVTNATTGAGFGVASTLSGASNTGYALYGSNSSASGYALYGNGAAQITGATTLSALSTAGVVLNSAAGLLSTSGGPLAVANGGTGAATLAAHDVLIGEGTSPIAAVSPSTSGFVLTSNGTGSDPSFQPAGGVTLTQGSVAFAGATGALTQDNANFFYDATNHRLGIGTAAPDGPLHVASSPIDAYPKPGVANWTSAVFSDNQSATIRINHNSGVSTLTTDSAGQSISISPNGVGHNTLFVSGGGNVGIGVTDSNAKLAVLGAGWFGDSSSHVLGGAGSITIRRAGGDSVGYINLLNEGTVTGSISSGGSGHRNDLVFSNDDSGNYIFNTGNVGIRTTDPIGVLNVAGGWNQNGAAPQIVVSDTVGFASGIGFKANGYGNTNIWMLYAYPASDGRFCMGINGVNEPLCLLSNGSWTTPSDARLKTDIMPISDSLKKLALIKGSYFRWKDPKMPGQQIGVIAQDVEKSFPDLVHKGLKGYKTVNYIGLIAPLIEAVKELKTDNDNEAAEIKQLKAAHDDRLAALEADNKELHKELEAFKAHPIGMFRHLPRPSPAQQ